MVSDLGSVRTGASQTSRGSRSTARSAKSRRKNEKKKFSTRRGSPTEHLGLLEEAKYVITVLTSFFIQKNRPFSALIPVFRVPLVTENDRNPYQDIISTLF